MLHTTKHIFRHGVTIFAKRLPVVLYIETLYGKHHFYSIFTSNSRASNSLFLNFRLPEDRNADSRRNDLLKQTKDHQVALCTPALNGPVPLRTS